MNLDAWRHRLRARLYEFLRRPGKAIAEYRMSLDLDPASAQATRALAFLLASRGQYAEAERCFHAALRLEPERATTWFNLGFMLDKQQQPAKAIEAFQEAVRLNSKLDRAWYGLGHCHTSLHDDTAAVADFERVIQIEPMNWHAWVALGMCFHRLQQPDKVRDVAAHINRYQRRLARQLIRDTGRTDLEHLIADLEP
jgi:tetratricopeptide (TPR) repeat protein